MRHLPSGRTTKAASRGRPISGPKSAKTSARSRPRPAACTREAGMGRMRGEGKRGGHEGTLLQAFDSLSAWEEVGLDGASD